MDTDEFPPFCSSSIESNEEEEITSSPEDQSYDFVIKVEEKTFHVNRSLLIETSEYFRALFASGMREVEEGVLTLTGVEASGFEQCENYIRTGKVDLNGENILPTLSASHLMQIERLTTICLNKLPRELTPENCVSALLAYNLYGSKEYSKRRSITQYLSKHFEDVLLDPDLHQISKDDLSDIVRGTSDQKSKWIGVAKWLSSDSTRDCHFSELLKNIEMCYIPFDFFLKNVVSEPFVQRSTVKKEIVAKAWFSNKLRPTFTTVDTFYDFASKIQKYGLLESETARNVAGEFLEEHLLELVEDEKFLALDREIILTLFKCNKSKCFPEKLKFEAAIKWVNHDDQRTNDFATLFESIELKLISPEFIQRVVRPEELVRKSFACRELLNDLKSVNYTRPGIASVYGNGHKVVALNLTTEKWWFLESTKQLQTDLYEIVNLKGDLYLMASRNIFRFNRDKTFTKFPACTNMHNYRKAVVFNDQIFVIEKEHVFVYNPLENSWTEKAGGCELDDGFCVVASKTSIYVIGVLEAENKSKKYDPANETWSEFSPTKNSRKYAAAAILNDNIYVMGGTKSTTNYEKIESVESYDPQRDVWMEISDMVHPRRTFSACVADNKIYAVGGMVGEDGWDSVEVYDERSGWTFVRKMSRGYGYSCCCPYSLHYLAKSSIKRSYTPSPQTYRRRYKRSRR